MSTPIGQKGHTRFYHAASGDLGHKDTFNFGQCML